MKLLFTALLVCSLGLASGQALPATSAKPATTENVVQPAGSAAPIGNSAHADSLIRSVQAEFQTLKKENELYRIALDVNANLFGGISTYFAIVAILLSVVVIAIPLVSYFLVYKPNEQLVAKVAGLEGDVLSKIEQNFENYFANLRKLQTQKMLAQLDDPLKVSEVAGYFMLHSPDELAAADIDKLIAFLQRDNGAEKTDLLILNSLVISAKQPAAEKYYKSVFETDDKKNYLYAIEYLVDNDFPTHLRYVEKIIAAADKSHVLLLDFFDYIAQRYLGNWSDKKAPEKKAIGVHYVKLLFDSDRIIKAIEGEPNPSRYEDPRLGRRLDINVMLAHPFLRETKYYPLYLQQMDEKHNRKLSAE
jgi:hypothetical protein